MASSFGFTLREPMRAESPANIVQPAAYADIVQSAAYADIVQPAAAHVA